ncbi:MAG: AAA family ATPase [Oligoflexales bacterium]|nr:AAA family ATPase [Oligoflexales bacterium]
MAVSDQEQKSIDTSHSVSLLRQQIAHSIFGQEDLVTEAMCCLLAGGHIIMTGAPGLAKTTLVRVIGASLNLKFRRVQFTPDLLPSDILGTEVLNVDEMSKKRIFEFTQGPIFTNLLLADEINRASPKTQSALLEAMQERTVTIAGVSHKLPQPFMVFATQNPYESEGTFPLPEAQLDRFLIHALVDYPAADVEEKILLAHSQNSLYGEMQDQSAKNTHIFNEAELRGLLEAVKAIPVPETIISAIVELVRSTRPDDELCPKGYQEAILYGVGPRAGINLISVARALAAMEGQSIVRWKHIRRLVKPVFRHRMRLNMASIHDGFTNDSVVENLLATLEQRHQKIIE